MSTPGKKTEIESLRKEMHDNREQSKKDVKTLVAAKKTEEASTARKQMNAKERELKAQISLKRKE